MTSPMLTGFESLVSVVYSSGCSVVLSKDGKTALLKGDASSALAREVAKHNDALVQMLRGDPSDGCGYLGRSTLFKQALRYMERRIKKRGGEEAHDRAIRVMCTERVMNSFNEKWASSGGDFESFREALREYVKAGIEASKRDGSGLKMTAKGAA